MKEKRSTGPNFRGKIGRNAQRQKREGKSFGHLILPKDANIFKEEVTSGKNRIELDILPYLVTQPNHPDKEEGAKEGEYWYRRPYWVHYGVGAENKSMVCPKTIGKPCPICEYRQKQFKDPDIKKEDVIGKPQSKNIYAVVVLNQKDYDRKKIHIWDIAQGNFQSILIDDLEERPELEIFPNLEDGLTLSIRFNEEVYNRNKFAQAGRIDYIERDYSYPESILDDVPKLDEILKVSSYKEIEAMFLELEEDDVEDNEREEPEEEKNAPVPRQRKTVSRVSKEEPEPEDEPEEPEDKPAPSLSRSKSSPSRRRREEPSTKTLKEEDCPNEHTFGKDWDDFEDCEGCELFETCGEKYEQLNK